jgi:LDH2 family malate/lactate/ureidoglycolate dehydrogenase
MLERFHVPAADEVRVSEDALRTTVASLFEAVGVPSEDAAEGADVLVSTDLRGVESHGVSNMLRHYLSAFREGKSNPRPIWAIVRDAPSAATIDGDGGLGVIQGPRAMRLAVEKAHRTGVGVVTMRNIGHLGAVGHHAMVAARADMVGVCMCATWRLVLPTFGAVPRLGTNPIAIAAPARNEPFLLFDAATSSVAGNKIVLAERVDAPVAPGWSAELDGRPIVDERPVPADFAYHLLPLGGTREGGSHKGYGLGLMVEVLTSLLAGNPPSMVADSDTEAHHFAAYNISAFTDLDGFKDTLDAMLRTLRETPPAPGEERVLYPGLPEFESERERRRLGIPLHREVVDWFDETTDDLGIDRLARLVGT